MKELTKAFNGREVRVIVKNGAEWFVARDVCDVLDIKNVSDALTTVADRHKTTIALTDSGSNYKHNALCVNEPGLYKLIFKSRKPEAEKFQDWVYEEVLPSIRKTGKYDVRDLRAKSTDCRNAFTLGCKRQGLTEPGEYGTVTKTEYKSLFNRTDIRKAEMNRDQILALSALEAVEALKYSRLPENTLKLPGIARSVKDTSRLLETAAGKPAAQIGRVTA